MYEKQKQKQKNRPPCEEVVYPRKIDNDNTISIDTQVSFFVEKDIEEFNYEIFTH